MKRLFVALITLAVAAQPGPVTSAPPSGAAPDDVAFCRDVVLPNVPQATLGECVGFSMTFYNSRGNGFTVHDCDAFLEIDPAMFYLFYDSYSDCVRNARQN